LLDERREATVPPPSPERSLAAQHLSAPVHAHE